MASAQVKNLHSKLSQSAMGRTVTRFLDYLNVEAGNVRRESFSKIWADSPLFAELRDLSNLKGKCGVCEYRRPCGGCRARAYEATGDYLEAEPYCVYQPVARGGSRPACKV